MAASIISLGLVVLFDKTFRYEVCVMTGKMIYIMLGALKRPLEKDLTASSVSDTMKEEERRNVYGRDIVL